MAQVASALTNKPAWVDLSTADVESAGAFYAELLGWNLEVAEDPQYGGYTTATLDGTPVAGIAPRPEGDQRPVAWSLYIASDEIDELARKVEEAGGSVLAQPFDVGDRGRTAVFADPSGAVLMGWQAAGASEFATGTAGAFGWAELYARGLERAITFYEDVFGWSDSAQPLGDDGSYTLFEHEGQALAGAEEMDPQIPDETQSHWLVYFSVDDVDGRFAQAIELGGSAVVAPQDMPGGRYAIVSDPQGAVFGIMNAQAQ